MASKLREAKSAPAEIKDLEAIQAVRRHVLAALGRPPRFQRVEVVHLWSGDAASYCRVNVLVEERCAGDLLCVTRSIVSDSFFVAATAGGALADVRPALTRRYA